MNPQLVILLTQVLLKYGPVVAEQLAELFHAAEPTLEDWKGLFAKVKTYEEYVGPVAVAVPIQVTDKVTGSSGDVQTSGPAVGQV